MLSTREALSVHLDGGTAIYGGTHRDQAAVAAKIDELFKAQKRRALEASLGELRIARSAIIRRRPDARASEYTCAVAVAWIDSHINAAVYELAHI